MILCSGALSAIDQALHSADRGGTILFFAPTEPGVKIPIELWDIWRDGITIAMSYAGPPAETTAAIELIRSQRVNVKDMITHRLSIEDTGKGFIIVSEASKSIKVIIDPHR